MTNSQLLPAVNFTLGIVSCPEPAAIEVFKGQGTVVQLPRRIEVQLVLAESFLNPVGKYAQTVLDVAVTWFFL